jgi:hypothetical protein
MRLIIPLFRGMKNGVLTACVSQATGFSSREMILRAINCIKVPLIIIKVTKYTQ